MPTTDTSPIRNALPFVLARRVGRTPDAEWRQLREFEGKNANRASLDAARAVAPLHDNYQTNRDRVRAEARAMRRAQKMRRAA